MAPNDLPGVIPAIFPENRTPARRAFAGEMGPPDPLPGCSRRPTGWRDETVQKLLGSKKLIRKKFRQIALPPLTFSRLFAKGTIVHINH